MLAALGDETRLALVARLAAERDLSIAELTARTRITRQAVTKHLQVLEAAGLVRGERIGRKHVWRFEAARLALARRSLDQISSWWDASWPRSRHGWRSEDDLVRRYDPPTRWHSMADALR